MTVTVINSTCLAQVPHTTTMDEDGGSKTPVVFFHDLIDELSPLFVPESTRQAFAEKLASLGAVGLPRATLETTSMHPTAIVISAGTASNTEISSEKFFKPGKCT